MLKWNRLLVWDQDQLDCCSSSADSGVRFIPNSPQRGQNAGELENKKSKFDDGGSDKPSWVRVQGRLQNFVEVNLGLRGILMFAA